MDTAILILQVLILLGLGAASLLFKSFVPKYLEEKGKNLATKQDVEDITEKSRTSRRKSVDHNQSFRQSIG